MTKLTPVLVGLATLAGLALLAPGAALAAHDGYAIGQRPDARLAAAHARALARSGVPAAALRAMPTFGQYGYSAAAIQAGVAFTQAHRPPVPVTVTAGQLLRAPGAGGLGYDVAPRAVDRSK